MQRPRQPIPSKRPKRKKKLTSLNNELHINRQPHIEENKQHEKGCKYEPKKKKKKKISSKNIRYSGIKVIMFLKL